MIPAITIYAWVNQIKKFNIKYLKKIRLTTFGLELLIGSDSGTFSILINYSYGFILPTLIKFPILEKQPSWIIKMRKILENARIMDIEIINLDRILKIRLRKKTSEKHIIIELFGKGNFIVTDSDMIIEFCEKKFKTKYRVIDIGNKYLPPTINKISIEDTDKIDAILYDIKEVKTTNIFRLINIDKYTIKEALFRAGLQEERYLTRDKIKLLLMNVKELLEISKECKEGYYIIKEDNKYIVLPYQIRHTGHLYKSMDLFSVFDRYLIDSLKINKKEINEEIEKLQKKKRKILETINKLMEEVSVLENLIPTLYSKLDNINDIIEKARKGILNNTILKIDYNKKVIYYPLTKNIKVGLRFDLAPISAINKLYETEIGRRKEGIKKLERQLNIIETTINNIKLINKTDIIERRKLIKRQWFEKFRWFLTSNNLLVISGKDAYTNEILIKKYLNDYDLIFHADYYGSPFTILKKGSGSTYEDKIEAAIFTASYSNAWRDGLFSIDVFYVFPNQISKKAPSGEYLKKGSFMIYGKKNYIRGVKLELWLGITKSNGKIFIGPKSAVVKHCLEEPLIKLLPGNEEKEIIIKKIVKIIRNYYPDTKDSTSLLLDEIRGRLPPGYFIIEINGKD